MYRAISIIVLVALAATLTCAASPVKPYTHATDYSWVCGRLERSSLEGGFWTVVYDRDTTHPHHDKYDGHFLLEVDARMMAGLRDGDIVLIQGHVDPDRMGIQMAGACYYAVKSIRRSK